MKQLAIGLGLLVFATTVGGVGLATAGFGVALPLIPIAIYIVIRGGYAVTSTDCCGFEGTRGGELLLGILLTVFGVTAIATPVGVPLFLAGSSLAVHAVLRKPATPNR